MPVKRSQEATEEVQTVLEDDQPETAAAVIQEAVVYLLAHLYGYDNELYQRLVAAIGREAAPPA